jgi:glycosyltransferase involved in cell wall biosynthesis
MRILHYSLGFPPYRSGGLTKFCMDLMKEQVKEGHKVALLWPGEIKLLGHDTRINKRSTIDEIDNYEVINPIPVSYDEGIMDFDTFMVYGNKRTYDVFLNKLKPDIIHIHTLMGLHYNFLLSAKENGIRLVFTTHDFYPICPKITMFRHGKICESIDTCEECGVCNNTALSLRKIQVLQSPLYRRIKESSVVKIMRKQHRDNFLSDDADRDVNGSVGSAEDYKNLRKHYQNMLSTVDMVHYNSTVTRNVYERFFNISKGITIPITHSDIADHRKRKEFSDAQLRFRYLGPQGGGKGYFLLRAALDKLWEDRQDFCLNVHFTPKEISPYLKIHERYDYKELSQIFEDTDVLIAPSIWYETFGYTVLEALSFGVPVIISNTVGAKDILVDGAGIIIDSVNPDKLKTVLHNLDTDKLKEMNKQIISKQKIPTVADMTREIIEKVYQAV